MKRSLKLSAIFFLGILLFFSIYSFLVLKYFKSTINDKIREKIKTKKLPNAIIIGASKSGTATLKLYLSLHPKVKVADEEINFFHSHYESGFEWYREQMPYSYDNDVTIEKSPDYFVFPLVPELIHKWNPNVKLILILREPITRAISQFVQLASQWEKNITLKETGKLFEKSSIKKNGAVNTRRRYIREGVYVKILQPWLDVFPLEQLLILDGEKLITDPYSVTLKAEKYLGLERHIKKSFFVFNKEKGFYCVNTQKIKNVCQNESKGRRHPVINETTIDKLKNFYRPYDKNLFKLIKQKPFWSH